MQPGEANPFSAPRDPEPIEQCPVARRLAPLWASAMIGSLLGMIVCVATMTGGMFVLGGITRAAPCHRAPDFLTGGMFGAVYGLYFFGLPALVVGSIGGAVLEFVRHRKLKQRMV